MRSALPQADPRDPSGISSELWIAHLGESSVGKGDGNFDRNSIVDDDARHRLQTSTSTSSATSSSAFSALACLRHPFVRALADGSLPVESFRFYVAQDFHFLTAFSRAYALAADAAASSGDTEASATLTELQQSIDEELELHRGFAASWGVVLEANEDDKGNGGAASSSPSSPLLLPRPSAATTDYTTFLIETASKAKKHSSSLVGVARALAAMVPCCRLYGWLGVKLAQEKREEELEREEGERDARSKESTKVQKPNPFSAWIETYSSLEYHAATCKLEALLDRLAEGLSAEERAALAPLFSRAMRLEHAFFTAAALSNSSVEAGASRGKAPPPLLLLPSLLVVDFDETLTTKDTTRLIIGAAASAASARGDEAERQRMEAAAAALVKRYVEEREALLSKELPSSRSSPPSLSSPSSSFDPATAAAFLSKLSAFDREANTRVFDSRILAGIRRGDLFELGRRRGGGEGAAEGAEGLLRPGAAGVLRRACALGVPTRVLSVSWSSELIEGVLTGALEKEEGGEEWIEVSCDDAAWGAVVGSGDEKKKNNNSKNLAAVIVAANALEFSSSSLSTGSVLRRVECADDKLERLTALVAAAAEEEKNKAERRGPVVFVGDSPSDLGALLAADLGIVIANPASAKAELRRVAEALGIRVAPLAEASAAAMAEGGGEGKTLFEARSWGEVEQLLFGDGRESGGKSRSKSDSKPSSADPHPAVPRVLSIAGSDSGGGAGIQADLKAASALGVFSATAVTAVTVQNSGGVSGVLAVPSATVVAQAEAVLGDIGADAIKTGMLPDAETVEAVAGVVEKWRRTERGGGVGGVDDDENETAAASSTAALHRRFPLVVDPVLVSTSGDPLASGGVAAAMVSRLFPLATVVTPNLPETAKLLGLDEESGDLTSLSQVAEAARRLAGLGAAWVLVKGGHAVSGFADDDAEVEKGEKKKVVEAVDVLFERSTGSVTFLRAPRVDTSVSHGTGCTLASALACGLARGLSVPAAARAAKRYVGGALAASSTLRLGRGPQFPMNHGYATAACDWASGEGLKLKGNERGVDYRLYVVTDPRLISPEEMRSRVAAAVRGGATVVQVRDKDAGPAALAASSAEAVRGAADGAGGIEKESDPSPSVFVLVNDRVDVAAGTPGVAGAHVGQGDLPAPLARRALGHTRLLGISVRTPEQALEAARQGADYVGAGAVFPTGTKEDATVIGLAGLAEIVKASPIPVVAIGGVTAANAGDAIRAGASGVAVVSAVFGGKGGGSSSSSEEEVERAARAVRAAVDAALAERK